MRFLSRRLVLAVAAAGCASSAVLAAPTAVHAATNPPYEPTTNEVGTVSFYDSSGNQVTSGMIADDPFATYAVGSASLGSGPVHLYFYNPSSTDPYYDWYNEEPGLQTANPVTSGPSSITTASSAGDPVAKLVSGDQTLSGFEQDSAKDATYANLVQVRVETGLPSTNTQYEAADLQIDTTAGTWTQIFPTVAAGDATTTTVTATPATLAQGGSASLGATVTDTADATATPVGTVQFTANGKSVGTAAALTAGATDGTATASLTTTALPPGTDAVGATFVPTDEATFAPSSATTTVTIIVNPKATTPKVTGTFQVGKKVTCAETVTAPAKATYQWKAASTVLGKSASLTLPASAVGKKVDCVATVAATGAKSASATSAAKAVAKGAALKATKKPALSGTFKVGKTVKVAHGTWSPSAGSYSYQWRVNGSSIKGATKSSYKLVSGDKGKKITVTVTAKKTGYNNGSAVTASKKVSS